MNAVPIKLLAASVFLFVAYVQWRRRYFSGIPSYVKQADLRRYGLIFMSFALLTALTFFIDPLLREAIQAIQCPVVDALVRFGGWLGHGANLWFILFSVYFVLLIFRLKIFSGYTFSCIASLAIASSFSSILKLVFLRARPYAHHGHLSFLNWPGLVRSKSVFQSFPSGDVVLVSAAVFYLFFRLGKSPLKWVLLILPFATAMSRIVLNRHWPSDTVFSMGLGLIAGQLVYQYENFIASTQNQQFTADCHGK